MFVCRSLTKLMGIHCGCILPLHLKTGLQESGFTQSKVDKYASASSRIFKFVCEDDAMQSSPLKANIDGLFQSLCKTLS